MRVPFTVGQFLEVFRRYNDAVWPAQWALYALGIAAVVLVFRSMPLSGRVISGILATLWLWMGVVYHLTFFRAINSAAVLFGIAFIAQAVLFAWLGVWRGRLSFRARLDLAAIVGGLLVLYALVVYLLLGYALGHRYPAAPTFGLPCPTAIFTFGLLLLAEAPVPRSVFLVPVLWAAAGTSAAVQLGMREDFGLLVAAVIGTLVALTKGHVARNERAHLGTRQRQRPISSGVRRTR
jgi:hypothetical protein